RRGIYRAGPSGIAHRLRARRCGMTEGLGETYLPAGDGRSESEEDTQRSGAGAQLDRLWARGRDILGCELAVMGGAMTWVSERNLVAAISNAGGFGVIA